jgi:hypothetical protein
MFIGMPRIMAAAFSRAASARSWAASAENLLRRIVSMGVAIWRVTSEMAMPMVLLPRSRPMSLSPVFSVFARSSSVGCAPAMAGM